MILEKTQARIQSYDRAIDGVKGAVQLKVSESMKPEPNLIGSPLVLNEKPVGMVVFQATKNQETIVEAVMSRTMKQAFASMQENPESSER